jgi:indole-3-glycerol phosphate synthase/phosphoribosylanthranilate isomerase
MPRFRDALAGPGLAGVAEVKRRSPSAGDLRPDADPAALAAAFEAAGAAAVSILVDERFAGSLADLSAARATTGLPLLAKGFFSTEEHLDEVRAAGADAALLILRDLDDRAAARLMAHAGGIGLDTLVEAHDPDELARAVELGADPIGVNARDLSTFAIDRAAQLRLVEQAPRDRVVIAESAVHTRAQGAAAELAGADAILVGTALMRAADPPARLRELLSRPLVKVCGLTLEEDVEVAVEAGADLCGFVLEPASPRAAERVLPVPDTTLSVAVFVGEEEETTADLVQLYERAEGLVRGRDAVLLRNGEHVATVVDLPWEGDDPSQLERARAVEGRLVLAGGLGAVNVGRAITATQPWAVDASSSLESRPGVKDPDKVRAFVAAARHSRPRAGMARNRATASDFPTGREGNG